jgi:chemotaxis protein CheD
MKTDLVGIGEIKIKNNSYDALKVVALGSCVAVIFYAPALKVAGVAHVALPYSLNGNGQINKKPGYYADEAIRNLVEKFKKLGIKGSKELIIKLVGGASIMDPNGTFDIGRRNVISIRKYLWQNRLGAIKEDVGKDHSRTVTVEIDTGNVSIKSPGMDTIKL